jgi:hypothetical protein
MKKPWTWREPALFCCFILLCAGGVWATEEQVLTVSEPVLSREQEQLKLQIEILQKRLDEATLEANEAARALAEQEEWGKFGKHTGQALAAFAEETDQDIEVLANSDAGKVIAAAVSWKEFGDGFTKLYRKTIRMAYCTATWLILMTGIIFSYFKTCIFRCGLQERIYDEETGNILREKYAPPQDSNSVMTMDGRRWAHVLIFTVFTVICIVTALI